MIDPHIRPQPRANAHVPSPRRRRALPFGWVALERRGLLSLTPGSLFPPWPNPNLDAWTVTRPEPPASFVGPISGSVPSLQRPGPGGFPLSLSSVIGQIETGNNLSFRLPALPTPGDLLARSSEDGGIHAPLSTIAMAESTANRAGVPIRTFAFADHQANAVSVRNGDAEPTVLGTFAEGVRHPDAIILADLDGDKIPDLIVANSGADNILVYRGLSGGGFASEANGGQGFTVGNGPEGITIDDVNQDGIPDVIVADRGSNDVAILIGQGRLGDWTLTAGTRLHVGVAPVFTALHDTDGDGLPDLLVCNSGSNTVMVLHALGGGQFDDLRPKTLAVGDGPIQLFLGRFDRRDGPELLTVNALSNNMTLISDYMGETPITQTIASGGLDPTSAFASDLNNDGFTDVVVANSGDGKLAYFQGGQDGLKLAYVATNPAVSAPTAVLLGDRTSDGFDVYTVSAGQNQASTLHFDLNLAGDFVGLAPGIPNFSRPGASDGETSSAQWVAHDESTFNLVGILGLPWRRGETDDEIAVRRDDVTVRINFARSGIPSLDDHEVADGPHSAGDEPDAPTAPNPIPDGEGSAWARYLLGVDAALDQARSVAGLAIAAPGLFDERAWSVAEIAASAPGHPEPTPGADPGSAVEAAIRSLQEGHWPVTGNDPAVGPDDPASDANGGRVEAIPTVSLGLIFAHQLLIRVAPSRRPRIRKDRLVPGRPEANGRPSPSRFG